MLSPLTILAVISVYFLLLYVLATRVQGKGDNATFFTGNRASPWYLVAFGMIGASLSGVTFISIPGVVGAGGANQAFSYMQMVMGYILGYLVITTVLLPIYYRSNITSIYQVLEERMGWGAYKSGAAFFLLSRTTQAAFRLYLVSIVLDQFVLGPMGVPFVLTTFLTILLIWIYTFRGGIKTIVWTDTLQTSLMILAVIFTVTQLSYEISGDHFSLFSIVAESDLSQWFYFEGGWGDPNNFFKQFLAGALITIVMTGLDQDMMQKNLTCRNLKEAQTNMTVFSIVLFFVNILFLSLGVLLYVYAQSQGISIPERTDQLYPTIALNHLSPFISIAFILGLIAAAYSTADSALTSLTTSYCVDFLDMKAGSDQDRSDTFRRRKVHIGFSVLLFVVIIVFNWLNNDAVINGLFKAAGYTYGPILGLFVYALLKEKHKGPDPRWAIILVCVIAPILTYILDVNDLFCGFKLGFLNLLLNGIISLVLISIVYRRYEKDH